MLAGTESAILNREWGDSNRAIPRSRPNIDRLQFGLATLNRLSAILHDCDSTHVFASCCGISGYSRPTIPGTVRFTIRDSVPLRPGVPFILDCFWTFKLASNVKSVKG